jgi:hypothetical protein
MKQKPHFPQRRKNPKAHLRLPDLECSKTAVLNSLASRDGQRGYGHAIDEFVDWYCSEPRHLRTEITCDPAQGTTTTISSSPTSRTFMGLANWKLLSSVSHQKIHRQCAHPNCCKIPHRMQHRQNLCTIPPSVFAPANPSDHGRETHGGGGDFREISAAIADQDARCTNMHEKYLR